MIFKAIEKYRYGRWKTVSKHLNPEKLQHVLALCFATNSWMMSATDINKWNRTNSHFLFHSDVISTVVKQFLSPTIGNNSNWGLCWQASTHGWAASTFHSRCDWKNHTVTIIKKGSYVFGGYTDIPWGKWVFIPGGWLVYERVGDTLWKIKLKL